MFKVSEDKKTQMFRGHKNATGHEALRGCPGATKGVGGCADLCYVHNMTRLRPTTKAVLEDNLSLLSEAKSKEDFISLLEPGVLFSEQQHARKLQRMRRSRSKENRRLFRRLLRGNIFRHHWSGDVLSRTHAEAVKDIAERNPQTTFWIYTRTWWCVKHLLGAENLIVNLSVDKVNEAIMRDVWDKMGHKPELRLTWMGDNPPQWMGDVVDCPAVGKKRSWLRACSKCKLCLHKRNKYSVRFPIH